LYNKTYKTKVILILAKKNEQSVSEVALWLNKNKVEYIRVNFEDVKIEQFVEKIEIVNGFTKVYFNHRGRKFTDTEISSIWIRHASMPNQLPREISDIENDIIRNSVNLNLKGEYKSIIKSVLSLIAKKQNIGDFYTQPAGT